MIVTLESLSGWITDSLASLKYSYDSILCWTTCIVVVPENESAHLEKRVHTSLYQFTDSVSTDCARHKLDFVLHEVLLFTDFVMFLF